MKSQAMKSKKCKLCKGMYNKSRRQQFCDSCEDNRSNASETDQKQPTIFKTKKISKKEGTKLEKKNEYNLCPLLRQDLYSTNQKGLQYLESLYQKDGSLTEGQQVMLAGLNHHLDTGHKQFFDQVKCKCRKLGYQQTDLLTLLQYIQEEAPITIFFNGSREINYLANNTLFMNENQTDSKNSTVAYLNLCNDLTKTDKNVKKGDSFFVLKDTVRKRCLIQIESSRAKIKKTNLRFGDVFLSSLSDNVLRSVIDGLFDEGMEESNLGMCKEIQILGQLRLERDIKQIWLSQKQGKGDYINVLEKVKAKYGIDYRII